MTMEHKLDPDTTGTPSEDATRLAMRVLLAINPTLRTVDKLNESVDLLLDARRERDDAKAKLADAEANRAEAKAREQRMADELYGRAGILAKLADALGVVDAESPLDAARRVVRERDEARRERDEAMARAQRVGRQLSHLADIVGTRPADARRLGETIAEAAQRVVAERDEARAARLRLDAAVRDNADWLLGMQPAELAGVDLVHAIAKRAAAADRVDVADALAIAPPMVVGVDPGIGEDATHVVALEGGRVVADHKVSAGDLGAAWGRVEKAMRDVEVSVRLYDGSAPRPYTRDSDAPSGNSGGERASAGRRENTPAKPAKNYPHTRPPAHNYPGCDATWPTLAPCPLCVSEFRPETGLWHVTEASPTCPVHGEG